MSCLIYSGKSFLKYFIELILLQSWISEISEFNKILKLETPLIKLASSNEEYKLMTNLYNQKKQFKVFV